MEAISYADVAAYNNSNNTTTSSSSPTANRRMSMKTAYFASPVSPYTSSSSAASPPSSSSRDAATELLDETHRETLSRTYALFQKLFSLDKPIVTGKMVEFFRKKEVLPAFCAFISMARPNPFLIMEDDDDNEVEEGKKDEETGVRAGPTRSEFQISHMDLLRMSAKAADLIVKPSQPFRTFLSEKAYAISKELLRIFDQPSMGCFQHFKKAMEALLKVNPVSVVRAWCCTNGFLRALNHLHEDAHVAEVILLVLSHSIVDECSKGQMVDALKHCRFLAHIASRICIQDSLPGMLRNKKFTTHQCIRISDTAMDFWIQVLDILGRDGVMCMALREVVECSDITDHLLMTALGKLDVANATSTTEPVRGPNKKEIIQKNAIESLLQLLRRGSTAWDVVQEAMAQQESPSLQVRVMAEIYCVWATVLLDWVSPLCVRIAQLHETKKKLRDAGKHDVGVVLSAYRVEIGFGTVRLALIELLNEFVNCQVGALDRIPTRAWECMVSWFFSYRFNNLFLVRFTHLLTTAVHENHVQTLKTVLANCKFLSRAVRHYAEIAKTDTRGCVVQLFNLMRLRADTMSPTQFLRNYLVTHNQWREFLPILRQHTELQVKKPFAVTHNRDKYTRVGLVEWEQSDEGIDLGSAYANKLGLQGLTPFVTDGKKARRLRNATRKSKVEEQRRENGANTSEEEQEDMAEASAQIMNIERLVEELSSWDLSEASELGDDDAEDIQTALEVARRVSLLGPADDFSKMVEDDDSDEECNALEEEDLESDDDESDTLSDLNDPEAMDPRNLPTMLFETAKSQSVHVYATPQTSRCPSVFRITNRDSGCESDVENEDEEDLVRISFNRYNRDNNEEEEEEVEEVEEKGVQGARENENENENENEDNLGRPCLQFRVTSAVSSFSFVKKSNVDPHLLNASEDECSDKENPLSNHRSPTKSALARVMSSPERRFSGRNLANCDSIEA
eukprot:ANDGO_02510.mRNA.1 hypothetical protein SDRG_09426